MATSMDARVRYLLKNLKLRLVSNPELNMGAGYELMLLNDELGCFSHILEEASTKYDKNDKTFKEWEEKIDLLVKQIEDIVDMCATAMNMIKQTSTTTCGLGLACRFPRTKRLDPAQEIRKLREDYVKPFMVQFQRVEFTTTQHQNTNNKVTTPDSFATSPSTVNNTTQISQQLQTTNNKVTTPDSSATTSPTMDNTTQLQTTKHEVTTPDSSAVVPLTIDNTTQDSQQLQTANEKVTTPDSSATVPSTINNTIEIAKYQCQSSTNHKVTTSGSSATAPSLINNTIQLIDHLQSVIMRGSLEVLVASLKQLVDHRSDLIGDAMPELMLLKNEIDTLNHILMDASMRFKKNKVFQQWERNIREAIYKVEDTIDTCVTIASARKKKLFAQLFTGQVNTFNEHLRSLRQDVVKPLMERSVLEHFTEDYDASDIIQNYAREIRQKRSQYFVGFHAEAAFFVNLMTRESDKSEVSSIIGMAGLGKSALAWKIFEDLAIKFEFPVRIWVNISDTLNLKKVLLHILSKFRSVSELYAYMNDEELILMVRNHLEEQKFLIVFDDVWTIDAWNKLQSTLLPRSNKQYRVLITTRHKDVGRYISTSKEHAHDLRFLGENESWELLQYQVFGRLGSVPLELVDIGQNIASNCGGLPLAIVVIGGILNGKTSYHINNIGEMTTPVWEQVSSSMWSYIIEEDEKKVFQSIISLSYDKLHSGMIHCFLYLGVFPKDAEIPVKKLICLWIAEGFVTESNRMTLEETAYNYLSVLIDWNLVMVCEAKYGGEAKTCRIHDSILEICKREGNRLNLFTKINKSEAHSDREEIRRLLIHSHALDFFYGNPKLPNVRSFLCFNESPMTLKITDSQLITDAFGLLRVYDAKNLMFIRFPAKLVQLIHLRYLTLTVATQLNILPAAITNLWNLQTLIVDLPSHIVEIKGDMLSMRNLRHFKTKASVFLKTNDSDEGGGKLQTLSRLSPESCTVEVCKKARSLVTLGIRGDLSTIEDLRCFEVLDSLKKLKLVHEVRRGESDENPWRDLPDSRRFPPNLKTLVLIGTRLDWTKMYVLSKIDTLEELKLKDNAFCGYTWEVTGCFARLTSLEIQRADLKCWSVEDSSFPSLGFLDINNCEKLTGIPSNLGKSLEVLSLARVTTDAVKSAHEIMEEQKKLGRSIRLKILAAVRNEVN